MLRPSIFNENFVDNLFDEMFSLGATGKRIMGIPSMKTDVREVDGNYVIEIDLPGYKKEDLKADLKDGYLTVSIDKAEELEENEANGRYIRRERYTGSCKRSFYVGEAVEEEDIRAAFDNGVLKLVFPKDKKKPEKETAGIVIE